MHVPRLWILSPVMFNEILYKYMRGSRDSLHHLNLTLHVSEGISHGVILYHSVDRDFQVLVVVIGFNSLKSCA